MKKIIRVLVCVCLFLIIGVVQGFASTPSEVVQNYFNLLSKKDYAGAAKTFDVEALAEFRKTFNFLKEIPESEKNKVYAQAFGEKVNAKNFDKISDTEFLTRLLENLFSMAGELSFGNLKVIGEVMEGQEMAHVVTRSQVKAGGIEIERMIVVSVKKNKEDWKVLFTGNMKGMAEVLKKRYAPSEK